MAAILLLFLVVFVVGCIDAYRHPEAPPAKTKRRTKARRRGGLRWMGDRKRSARESESNKPYGLPWMGGTMNPKKKDYFDD